MVNYQGFSISNNENDAIIVDFTKAVNPYYEKISNLLKCNDRVVTVCFSTHRVEVINLFTPIMNLHDVIVLEEPPSEEFSFYMNGEISLPKFVIFNNCKYKSLISLHKALLISALYVSTGRM